MVCLGAPRLPCLPAGGSSGPGLRPNEPSLGVEILQGVRQELDGALGEVQSWGGDRLQLRRQGDLSRRHMLVPR